VECCRSPPSFRRQRTDSLAQTPNPLLLLLLEVRFVEVPVAVIEYMIFEHVFFRIQDIRYETFFACFLIKVTLLAKVIYASLLFFFVYPLRCYNQ